MSEVFDAVVIGMGPGGEVAASRLLAAGRRVAVVERELIGGECGYWACIPSKTLLRPVEVGGEAAQAGGLRRPDVSWPELRDWRDTMIRHLDDHRQVAGYREQGATVIKGAATLAGPREVDVDGRRLAADHIIVATGSGPARPPIEGIDDVPVWTNREATNLTEIPGRALMIGGSAVGVELGQFLAGMGTRVTIVQRGPRLLDREDPRLGQIVGKHMAAAGIDVRAGVQALKARRDGDDTVVELSDGSSVRTDVIILGAGRRPNTEGLGLAAAGVEPGSRGELRVDEQCKVADGLWAIGDVTGVAMFTHVAKYQARIVADTILGKARAADYTGVPRVVFAQPEIAAVGLTPDQATSRGLDVAAIELDVTEAIARPWTYEVEPTGTLSLIADRRSGVLLGAWGVAPLAGEWIHVAALAIRHRLPVEALAEGIPQFPTYAEAYVNAAERMLDELRA